MLRNIFFTKPISPSPSATGRQPCRLKFCSFYAVKIRTYQITPMNYLYCTVGTMCTSSITTRTTTDPTTKTENVPRDLLTTTTLTLPERFFFLRTYMGAKVDIFGLRHPAPPNNFYNCLIFIPRYLMAQNVMKSKRLE